MPSKFKFNLLTFLFVLVTIFSATNSSAIVESNWPIGTSNTPRNPEDTLITFEQGIEAAQVESTNPGIEFTTTSGLNWQYADFRTGNYNLAYTMNGNITTWLGITGDSGRITFKGGTATYVSVLVKTYSGVEIDAYDADGNFLANSGRADNNLSSETLTRLTVEAEGIAYVEIHDTGNYWTIDDLCTDAPPPIQPVPGRTIGEHDDRIDLVFVPDEDYDGDIETFLEHVNHKIDDRLGGVVPIDGNLDKFNFYYTELEGDSIKDTDTQVCGPSTLPDKFLNYCPWAEAIVVLHNEWFSDCNLPSGDVGYFSAEGPPNLARSFIHEAGHGLFGLKDEYDYFRNEGTCVGSTNYRGGLPPSNTWATEEECRADCTNEGWDPDQCYMYTQCQDDWWKLGDASLETNDDKYYDDNFKFIMFDGDWFSNGFGDASEKRINFVFDNIMDSQTQEGSLPSSNEKSIVLKLEISDSGVFLNESNFTISASPNYIRGYNSYETSHSVNIYSESGILLGTYDFADGRLVDAEMGYAGPTEYDNANLTLIIPYFNNIGSAQILDNASGQIVLVADLSNYSVDIKGDVDSDGDVDRDDLNILILARNSPALGYDDPRDLDADGMITALDTRVLVTLCTRARCACE